MLPLLGTEVYTLATVLACFILVSSFPVIYRRIKAKRRRELNRLKRLTSPSDIDFSNVSIAKYLTVVEKSKLDSETRQEDLELVLQSLGFRQTFVKEISAKSTKLESDKLIPLLRKEVVGILNRKLYTPIWERDDKDADSSKEGQKASRTKLILLVGVNGSGKTSTCARLAKKYKSYGKKVMLVAGDTFRSGAIEQLAALAKSIDVKLYSKEKGSRPSTVAYEAFQLAQKEGVDALIVDTSGRLGNNTDLIDELTSIVNAIRRLDSTAPHDTLLVFDASVGHSAISEVKNFSKNIPMTGLVFNKVDSAYRGGSIISLVDESNLPIAYLGIGPQMDDIVDFSPEEYTNSLFKK